MADKSELVAFEREKRLYKDAYVENFRSVRYFPSLAAIGAGRANGDSIVLMQEPQLSAAAATTAPESSSPPKRSRFDDVASRLIPPDSLEEIFDTALPLTTFRSAIMCKHSKVRRERRATASSSSSKAAPPSRYKNTVRLHLLDRPTIQSSLYPLATDARHMHTQQQPGVFKPTSVVEAKGAIQRKVTYDGQPYRDKTRSMRQASPRADAQPQWARNNPTSARNEICGKTFFNVPTEGPIMADRKYTQEFIRQSMESYNAGRRHAASSTKTDSRYDY